MDLSKVQYDITATHLKRIWLYQTVSTWLIQSTFIGWKTSHMSSKMTNQEPEEVHEGYDDGDSSSDSEIGLELECNFSDFEVESEGSDADQAEGEADVGPEVLGVEPYQFEPVRRADVIPPRNIEQQENRGFRMQGTETW